MRQGTAINSDTTPTAENQVLGKSLLSVTLAGSMAGVKHFGKILSLLWGLLILDYPPQLGSRVHEVWDWTLLNSVPFMMLRVLYYPQTTQLLDELKWSKEFARLSLSPVAKHQQYRHEWSSCSWDLHSWKVSFHCRSQPIQCLKSFQWVVPALF